MQTWTEIIVPSFSPNGSEEAQLMLNRSSFLARLNEFRTRPDFEESTVLEVMLWYMAVNNAMLEHLTNLIKETDKSGMWR